MALYGTGSLCKCPKLQVNVIAFFVFVLMTSVVVLSQYELPLRSEFCRKLQEVCLNMSCGFVESDGLLS